MKKEYDFDTMKGRKNPYAKKLKKQITIRLDEYILEYFKKLASENEMSYQSLINLYLKECVVSGKKLQRKWVKAG